MTTVRTGKSKGSQFEMDCKYSLSKIYPEIIRTGSEGFQLQYDLECNTAVFECKRLKGMSWNQAKKYFEKLESKSEKRPFLLLKSNLQPCIVMYRALMNPYHLIIVTFEDYFGTPFEKHPSTRGKK